MDDGSGNPDLSGVREERAGQADADGKRTGQADDAEEKNETIMKIVRIEWEMFQNVHNEGGRADCQDNWDTFHVMRESQYDCWPQNVLDSLLADMQLAEEHGRNLISEKYARMMASTSPEKYRDLEPFLPGISERKRKLTEEIIGFHREWMLEHARKYPNLSARGRVLFSEDDTEWNTSAETYLRGELLTWSEETLELYLEFVRKCREDGVNLVIEQDRNMVKFYGFRSLEEAEERNRTDG